MKTFLKITALCIGLFISSPSFSQDVTYQVRHPRHHRVVLYTPGTYRHEVTAGNVTYRHEYGPGYTRHTRFLRDENGNIINRREVTRDANGNIIQRRDVLRDQNGNIIHHREVTRDANGNIIRRDEQQVP